MAFSAGPYGAALADGSEYNGSYAERVTEEQIMDFHAKRLHVSQALPVTSISWVLEPCLCHSTGFTSSFWAHSEAGWSVAFRYFKNWRCCRQGALGSF